VLHGVSK